MGNKKKKPDPGRTSLLKGLVLRSTGSRYKVQDESGALHECVIRGKIRLAGLDSTNPVVTGDWVEFIPQAESELGVISGVLPRKNLILRKAISFTRRVHILCANVDQAVLLFSLESPVTSTGFADRFLVAAESYEVPVRIIFNKTDLLPDEEARQRLSQLQAVYGALGYENMAISATSHSADASIREWFAEGISFLGGHSGAGKSTIGNLLDPGLRLRTGEVSDTTGKGAHTTTFAELHPLPGGGWIIDSPGIRELGVTDLEPAQLAYCFPEIRDRATDCRFRDCTHRNEPGCAILPAVATGEIASFRYDSYLKLFEELTNDSAPGMESEYQL